MRLVERFHLDRQRLGKWKAGLAELAGRTWHGQEGQSGRLTWSGAARLIGLATLVAAFAAFLFVVDCAFEIPLDGGLAAPRAAPALVVKAADDTTLATRGTIRGEMLGADEISDNLKKAIVAIEDRRFYKHGAIDPRGIARAFYRDAISGRTREGASTITQQLARLMLLSSDRTLRRKVQEILIAAWLEHHLTKPEILARYLDTAYFGAGAYGADAAAQRYFGKSARDLDLPEAAMLAGLVRAPSALAPHRNLEAAQARAKLVLRAMAATGAITKEAADTAIAKPATLKVAPETPSGPGYVADAAASDVKGLVGDAALDLSARTTIDPEMQATAEKAVAAALDKEGAGKNASQAALVALGADGAILAMVGGRDYEASGFNRAMQAKRQPGSLFKMFVYMAALKQGATPETRVVDKPVKIGDWEPHNFDERYRGPMRLSQAFALSVNTVAVDLAQQVGIKTVAKTAHELGIASTLPEVPSLALGSAEVNLMEMTRAFATVASDRDTVEPYLVRRIASRDKVLMNRPPRYAGDGEAGEARTLMRELLSSVVTEGTGRGARLPFPTSGKTGTTQDYRDAWFIGSAPEITVGVWVGNDDNSPMKGVTGGDMPLKIWREVVVAAEAAMERKKAGAREKTARSDAALTTARSAARDDDRTNADATGKPISGAANVVDTSTLAIRGRQIRLLGVAPMRGLPAQALARHLGRREVDCLPARDETFRCTVEDDDLATVILANGGSEATPDAPDDLIAARDAARSGRRGIWRRRR